MEKLSWNPALKGRSLVTLRSFTDEEMLELIDLAISLKARKAAGKRGDLLHHQNIALIFEKSSTRTHCSCAVAARDEGGSTEYLTRNDIHLGLKESVADSARVLGRLFDGILFRGFSQQVVEDLAKYSGIPVWNGLTDDYHPTQILADLMTLKEHFGRIKGLKVAYVGDGRNNVANSLMLGCAKAGVNYVNCTPPELMPDTALVEECREIAKKNGSTVEIFNDPAEGVRGANAIYTDVWVSMGEEDKKAERIRLLRPYQVNAALFKAAAEGNPEGGTVFLHCLPAFHDRNTTASAEIGEMEVTDEIFQSPMSLVFDEAENRMHTIKALFVSAIADQP